MAIRSPSGFLVSIVLSYLGLANASPELIIAEKIFVSWVVIFKAGLDI
jgi:hypothetical protein